MSTKEIITNIKKLGLTVENEKEFSELAKKNNLDLSFLISQKVKINIENKRVKLIKL